ncbi:MAG: hypothetical protein IKW58_01230 [Alphaproteobacteria bacterium]|nr:hypothetical protein [Alphaproteobacteria bacterium]
MSKNKAFKNGKQLPQRECFISLKTLAKRFGVKEDALLLAIAETSDDDGVFDSQPVALIAGTDEYIDLSDGIKKKNATARGLKQNFFDCNVKHCDKTFEFSSSLIKASISDDVLIKNFGSKILTN